MARIHIKIGNPIIKTDTETVDIENYRVLCEEVNKQPNITEVVVMPDKVDLFCRGVSKKYKYPKNVLFEWLLEKVRNVDAVVAKQLEDKELAKGQKNFLKLAEDLINKGGSAYFDNNEDFIVTYGTFVGKQDLNWFRKRSYSVYVERLTNLVKLSKTKETERQETERLKNLVKHYNL